MPINYFHNLQEQFQEDSKFLLNHEQAHIFLEEFSIKSKPKTIHRDEKRYEEKYKGFVHSNSYNSKANATNSTKEKPRCSIL